MAHLAADRADRCPRCHTRPADWVDDRGMLSQTPAFVVELDDCPGCAQIESRLGMEDDEDRRRMPVRLRPSTPFDFLT